MKKALYHRHYRPGRLLSGRSFCLRKARIGKSNAIFCCLGRYAQTSRSAGLRASSMLCIVS
jgi:hypothetical protein